MRGLIGISLALVALLSSAVQAHAQSEARVGDTFEIVLKRQTSQRSSDGSSGSSQNNSAVLERVVGVRADGLELEYDFPKEASGAERASTWQLPVRIFKPYDGPVQLLNGPVLEARIDRWLKAAGWSRAVCGRWIFTWNALLIECDPQAALKGIAPFDLRPADLREGATFRAAEAQAPGVLIRKASDASGQSLAVELTVDPDAVRRTRAASDVAVGEMMKKPVTFDAALAERAKEAVSGTILVTFDLDAAGGVKRRTTITTIEVKGADGRSEAQTVTETAERERLSAG